MGLGLIDSVTLLVGSILLVLGTIAYIVDCIEGEPILTDDINIQQ